MIVVGQAMRWGWVMGLARDPVMTVRAVVGSAVALVFAGGMTGVGGVEVTPSTARPGQSVSIAAGPCGTPATAYSAAFGATMARLRRHDREMQGAARISPHAAPGTYAVTVRCVEGGPYNGTLVVGDDHPVDVPATGGGDLAMTGADHTARTFWLFGSLIAVVTMVGAGFALVRGRHAHSDH
ncbi:hypothetical protein FHR32_003914 [Streptosporangium album]|uniref:Uncharacterized protein n=1 Tax=Streptosporangium album TaxID=47479 RepID=A0A7W7RWM6_9ACTN|nr:hypothetical protein [Streptosporangium album]MBB4939609.1 hypothetical protein [Streptosporangium album]